MPQHVSGIAKRSAWQVSMGESSRREDQEEMGYVAFHPEISRVCDRSVL